MTLLFAIHPDRSHEMRPRRFLRAWTSYLLDVVIAQGASVLQLLAGEDQALLVRRDALLVLDLGLDVVDRVAGLDLEGDGLAREGLDEAGRVDGEFLVPRFVAGEWLGDGRCKTAARRGLHLHWME